MKAWMLGLLVVLVSGCTMPKKEIRDVRLLKSVSVVVSAPTPAFIRCGGVAVSPFHVVTAHHCVWNEKINRPEFWVGIVTQGERRVTMKIIYMDPTNDIAVLSTEGKHKFQRWAQLADDSFVGEDVTMISGHYNGELLAPSFGRVSVIATPHIRKGAFFDVIVGVVWGGMSGGGVFNSLGELVGIVSMRSTEYSIGYTASLKSVRKALKKVGVL